MEKSSCKSVLEQGEQISKCPLPEMRQWNDGKHPHFPVFFICLLYIFTLHAVFLGLHYEETPSAFLCFAFCVFLSSFYWLFFVSSNQIKMNYAYITWSSQLKRFTQIFNIKLMFLLRLCVCLCMDFIFHIHGKIWMNCLALQCINMFSSYSRKVFQVICWTRLSAVAIKISIGRINLKTFIL